MSNYVEYNDRIAFHPGYYIKEIIEESKLTQEDFAKRLATTPKNLSLLVRGEQSLSVDIAMKLSRLLGTSIGYWLNLQNEYDSLIAEFKSEQEFEAEKEVFAHLDYKYFRDNYGLPDLPRKVNEQICAVREFLKVSTLTVFKNRDMAVSFRNEGSEFTEANTVKANVMVQIAMNQALKKDAPKYNRKNFENAVEYALTLTRDHANFYPLIKDAFFECGVILEILPNIAGSRTNGATKKIGNNVMLMINDLRLTSDSFWFTLFHEIGHILQGDFGISFENELGDQESLANRYAEDKLIPRNMYQEFCTEGNFDKSSIVKFADLIERDPGIVLGRLQHDKRVDWSINMLKYKYIIKRAFC